MKSMIYLRLTNGKGQRVKISLNQPVSSLQKSIKKLLKNAPNNYQLFFKGAILDQHSKQSLMAAGVTEDCIIHVLQQLPKNKNRHLITIKVRVDRKEYSFEVQTAETIRKLKILLSKELNLDADDILLSYLGFQMEDSKRIEDYKVEDNALLSAFTVNQISKESQILRHYHIKQIPPNSQATQKERLQRQTKQISKEVNQLFLIQPEQLQGGPLKSLDRWMNDRKKQEVFSLNGDDDNFNDTECLIEITRTDKQREYLFSCKSSNTFKDVKKLVGMMDNVPETTIRLKLNNEFIESQSNLLFKNQVIQRGSHMSQSLQEEGKDNVLETIQSKLSLDDQWGGGYPDKMDTQVYQSELVEDESAFGSKQNTKIIVLEYDII